jgi:hypothetical protein
MEAYSTGRSDGVGVELSAGDHLPITLLGAVWEAEGTSCCTSELRYSLRWVKSSIILH